MFCLLRSAADRDPSLLLLTVNISHAVMNVQWPESRSRLSALTSCAFSLSISRLLFLTTIYSHLCLGQSCVLRCGHRSLSMGKSNHNNSLAHFSNHVIMCLIKYSAQWRSQTVTLKKLKGHELHAVGHQQAESRDVFMVKQPPIWHFITFSPLEGTLEATLSCFLHWRGP